MDLSKVEPYDGPLIFGPEVFEVIEGKGFDPADLEEEVLKAEFDLAAALNDAVDKGGKVAINLGATLTTSRLVTLGFLSQAKESGRKTYQVDEVLDDRTCPVCMEMNGTHVRRRPAIRPHAAGAGRIRPTGSEGDCALARAG